MINFIQMIYRVNKLKDLFGKLMNQCFITSIVLIKKASVLCMGQCCIILKGQHKACQHFKSMHSEDCFNHSLEALTRPQQSPGPQHQPGPWACYLGLPPNWIPLVIPFLKNSLLQSVWHLVPAYPPESSGAFAFSSLPPSYLLKTLRSLAIVCLSSSLPHLLPSVGLLL